MGSDRFELENRPFQILSLSGGGYKGVFSLKVLCELQRSLSIGRIYECVDAYIGTSVGSIISCGLAVGEKTAPEILDLFKENGPTIFKGRPGIGYRKARYNHKNLRKLLEPIFDGRTFDDLERPCYVTAVDVETRRTLLLGGFSGSNKHYSSMKIEDAIIASISAPAYFPFTRFEHPRLDQENPGSNGWLVDGGVAANAPELLAISDIALDFGLQINDFLILSIGTTFDTKRLSYLSQWETKSWGAIRWLLNREVSLTDLIFSSQVNTTLRIMNNLSLKNNYIRLDAEARPGGFELDDHTTHDDLEKLAEEYVHRLLSSPLAAKIGSRTALFLSRGNR